MKRSQIIKNIGIQHLTSNNEEDGYSYVAAAGSKERLASLLDYEPEHYKLDIRFEFEDVVILVETKTKFKKDDEAQLRTYLDEEIALHHSRKIICILANTDNDQVKVWKQTLDDVGFLENEIIIDSMEYYQTLFIENNKQNNREKVLKNTYALNKLLHKKDIDEKLRSQFVGTTLLYIQDVIKKRGYTNIDNFTCSDLKDYWSGLSENQIRTGIEDTLKGLLNGSESKTKKIELIQKNVLDNQKIKRLTLADWIETLVDITKNIYAYIDTESSEGQDILNLFFIAFNKYTGKSDKNQAFTPDHIAEFMCRVTNVGREKRIFDGTCGSGSFLVQALVKQLADCSTMRGNAEQKASWAETVKRERIYGIEIEENAYGLATTNMLIHGDGNSNIKLGSLFKCEDFIRTANPDIVLMNPPYNAKPITIPFDAVYPIALDEENGTARKKQIKSENHNVPLWLRKKITGKEDPTKGFVFIQFISNNIKKMNEKLLSEQQPTKEVKLAVLLPVSAAIGTGEVLTQAKHKMLEDNTLEGVFTLPNEIFYPGASVSTCCMVFTLGKPHVNSDGTINKTFFGYYKEDGFKKKSDIGRIEQFDKDNNSLWREIEENWLSMYRNKAVVDGLSAMAVVTGDDEWLCEAYMKTDYTKLTQADFQNTLNNHIAHKVKVGEIYES